MCDRFSFLIALPPWRKPSYETSSASRKHKHIAMKESLCFSLTEVDD
jgi:hypothetical protein